MRKHWGLLLALVVSAAIGIAAWLGGKGYGALSAPVPVFGVYGLLRWRRAVSHLR
jgi:hypothetical protein